MISTLLLILSYNISLLVVRPIKYTSLYMKLADALSEYDYALYDYSTIDKIALNPQNEDLFFVVFNL